MVATVQDQDIPGVKEAPGHCWTRAADADGRWYNLDNERARVITEDEAFSPSTHIVVYYLDS